MSGSQRRGIFVLGIALALAGALGGMAPAAERPQAEKLRLGIVESLFRGMPRPMAIAASQPFRTLMHTQTGLQGDVTAVGDAAIIANQLAERKIDLAIFNGFEFGWARTRHADLRPLVIAVNGSRHLRAHVVVPREAAVEGLADLKGKLLALPKTNRDHCRLYLERSCSRQGQVPSEYFAALASPPNAEDALDDVVDGTVPAVVVDSVALDLYKRRKPARFERLKEVAVSEVFPAGVIAYRENVLDAARQRRLRDGLLAANQTAQGRQLMTLWRLTGFEKIPDDYDQTLSDIVKVYPAPALADK
jgi:ABC-type phosphate/phosphonate transport system substrate-binding protein